MRSLKELHADQPEPVLADYNSGEAKNPLGQLRAWRALAEAAREQRRHHRRDLQLAVRFMGADNKEGAGLVQDITAGGASVETDHIPPIGLPIVLYIDEIGRVEGLVVRHVTDYGTPPKAKGFAVRFMVSPAKSDRLIDKLTLLLTPLEGPETSEAGADPDGIPAERRSHPRKSVDESAILTLADGRSLPCRVIDMSLSGILVEAEERPAVGSHLSIGRARGRVSRHHERGFAISLLHN